MLLVKSVINLNALLPFMNSKHMTKSKNYSMNIKYTTHRDKIY